MKKTGKGWERISWDEPLDTICQGYKQVIQEHGPDSIVIGQGTGRDYDSFLWY